MPTTQRLALKLAVLADPDALLQSIAKPPMLEYAEATKGDESAALMRALRVAGVKANLMIKTLMTEWYASTSTVKLFCFNCTSLQVCCYLAVHHG